MRLTEQDHATVTAAVAAAERHTAGEIVTVVARRSDQYNDVAAHAGVLAMLLVLAVLSIWPQLAARLEALFYDPWQGPHPGAPYAIALVLAALAFLVGRYALASLPLRIALTPGATKTRRARARALDLFRASAEKRTAGATGVLIYLSLDEHRAELIADAAIHGKVPPEIWGAAMAALIAAVKDDRPGDGMAAAVAQVGVVLAEHFPRVTGDRNELPDRLIEL
ncbi:TPM domain-containing protein [Sphingomonas qilianensis]|uniref:TPM domain-containing protein n=1 Tax=Sphingomonas qilianensis TaxID=1736690 RepID=A0ABU9XTS8_9SPHN